MKLFIVDRVGVITEAPPLVIYQALIVNDRQVSTPVAKEVQEALERADVAAVQLIRVALAPFGLSPYDIARPQYRQIIKEKTTWHARP